LPVSLKSTMGWLGLAAFLALPNCTLDRRGLGTPAHLNAGSQPWDSALFCDVESQEVARHCATPDEQTTGIPLNQAALALVNGQSSNIGLDFSPAAIAALGCSPGQPVAITFLSPFPAGISKCLNCGEVIGPVYADVSAACVDVCRDLSGGADAFCADPANVHRASTNAGSCFPGACTGNALPMTFVDPRRTPEPVSWTSLVGVATSGADSNTLTKTAATTGSFDAGAASSQLITHGDGYVEFTASETNTGRICGLSTGASDGDATQTDIGFGINLNAAGGVRIFEHGVPLASPPAPNPDTTFASYVSGNRLRVSFADNFDGTATITYWLFPPACPGCSGMMLHSVGGALYPFRVDATFNQPGGTLSDVRIVRIR
jgi:hypothetical protein